MVRYVIFTLFAVLLLSACSPAGVEQLPDEIQDKPLVTVYREPT